MMDTLETFILSVHGDCVIFSGDCNIDFSRISAHTIELMNLFNCIYVKQCITSLNQDISLPDVRELIFHVLITLLFLIMLQII